ncbi:MAG: hypothetical protein ACR2H0_04685 [Candidatus Limnocylindrales bacterium]
MERAQALERGASLPKLNGLADEIDEIDLLFDLCGYANGRGRPPVNELLLFELLLFVGRGKMAARVVLAIARLGPAGHTYGLVNS